MKVTVFEDSLYNSSNKGVFAYSCQPVEERIMLKCMELCCGIGERLAYVGGLCARV